MARNFKLAIEEVELDAGVVDAQPVEEVIVSEEVPEGTSAVNSAEFVEEQNDFENYLEDNNDAIQACTSLEALYDVVLNSHDKGGLTLTSAALAMETIARIRKQVGFAETSGAVVGFESFDKASNRRLNTDIALEAIGETISKIWASVVRGIKIVRKHFKSFIDSWRLTTNNYTKAVNSFHKRLSQVTTETTNKKFTNNNGVGALTFRGKFDPVGSVQAAKKLVEKHPVVVTSFTEVISAIRKLEHVQELVKKGEVPEIPLLKSDILPIKMKAVSGQSSFVTTYTSDEDLPGEATVTGMFASNTATPLDMLSSYHSCTVKTEFPKSPSESSEDFMTKQELSSLINDMEAAVKAMNIAMTTWDSSCDVFYAALESAEKAGSTILATVIGGAVGGGLGVLTGNGVNIVAGAKAGARFANKLTNKTYFNAIGALIAAASHPIYGSISVLLDIADKSIASTGRYVNQNLKALGA